MGGAGEGVLIRLSPGTGENCSICISGCILILPSPTLAAITFPVSEEQDDTRDYTRDEFTLRARIWSGRLVSMVIPFTIRGVELE